MSFPTKYRGWITYIKDWLSADEYSDAQIASFIDLAHVRLNREMSSYGMEASILLPVTTPFVITDLVPDFNKIRLVSTPGAGSIDVAAINEIKNLLVNDSGGGEPTHYCIDAGKLYTYPAMVAGNMEIFYYRRVPALSADPPVDSNVFTVDHPDALLFAALMEAAPYMQEDDRIPVWENKYTVALATGNFVSDRIKKGSTPLKRDVRIFR